jgi:YegS/Rv2252/BmrU family lipid kinase
MSETVIIYNPQSRSGAHTDTVRARADLRGYDLERTEQPGEAITLTREAVEAGYSTIVAGGGDGTVNEVVRGIDQADGFDDVTFGLLPLGTGNNFAEQIGVTDLETAFTVLDEGARRRIDLGWATDRPFVNSCVAGLTATSSSETSASMKSRIGELAYVLTTLRTAADFESLQLTIDSEASDGETPAWSGEALCVMVGNGRRFTTDGTTQADMEDGLFEVAIVRDVAALDLMSDRVLERLLGQDSTHIDRFQTPSLTITSHSTEPVRFSLDGEIIQQHDLVLDVRSRTLRLAVGAGYDPAPTDE